MAIYARKARAYFLRQTTKLGEKRRYWRVRYYGPDGIPRTRGCRSEEEAKWLEEYFNSIKEPEIDLRLTLITLDELGLI